MGSSTTQLGQIGAVAGLVSAIAALVGAAIGAATLFM